MPTTTSVTIASTPRISGSAMRHSWRSASRISAGSSEHAATADAALRTRARIDRREPVMAPPPPMPLSAEELQRIARETLAHYDQRADDFWAGTRDHDVRQNIDALLQQIEGEPPFSI